ncbi:MAG: hypothetical protein ACLQLH_07170 [Terracidiphilus sp.]
MFSFSPISFLAFFASYIAASAAFNKQSLVTPSCGYAQDGDEAIWVDLDKDFGSVPGDRVLIRGITQPSFRTYAEARDAKVIRPQVSLLRQPMST